MASCAPGSVSWSGDGFVRHVSTVSSLVSPGLIVVVVSSYSGSMVSVNAVSHWVSKGRMCCLWLPCCSGVTKVYAVLSDEPSPLLGYISYVAITMSSVIRHPLASVAASAFPVSVAVVLCAASGSYHLSDASVVMATGSGAVRALSESVMVAGSVGAVSVMVRLWFLLSPCFNSVCWIVGSLLGATLPAELLTFCVISVVLTSVASVVSFVVIVAV